MATRHRIEEDDRHKNIRAGLTLTEDGRVIYPDKTIGSYADDLIRFYLKTPGAERPLDSPQFASIIEAKKKKINWITYEYWHKQGLK